MPSSTSSRSYSVVEPHPTAQPRAYLASGRGGAGNYSRAPSNLTAGPNAQGPPSRVHLNPQSSFSPSSTKSPSFYSGRGGAGNVHPATERAIFSFDEELERQLSQDRKAAPVYHVGRGGAGNTYGGAVNAYPRTARRSGSDSEGDDRRSEKSVGSVESGADAATRAMKKQWKKMLGGQQ